MTDPLSNMDPRDASASKNAAEEDEDDQDLVSCPTRWIFHHPDKKEILHSYVLTRTTLITIERASLWSRMKFSWWPIFPFNTSICLFNNSSNFSMTWERGLRLLVVHSWTSRALDSVHTQLHKIGPILLLTRNWCAQQLHLPKVSQSFHKVLINFCS